jgi:hypothetical protein
MNIRRGLFRLWIFFAVAWIGGFAALAMATWEPKAKYLVTDPTGKQFQVEAPANLSAGDVIAYVEKENARWPGTPENQPSVDSTLVQIPRNQYLWVFVLLALVGPLGLLVIGSGLYWALLGFTSRN